MATSFWLDLFTWKSWNEFLKAGGNISGFKESRWSTVKKIKPGDILGCHRPLDGIFESSSGRRLPEIDKVFSKES